MMAMILIIVIIFNSSICFDYYFYRYYYSSSGLKLVVLILLFGPKLGQQAIKLSAAPVAKPQPETHPVSRIEMPAGHCTKTAKRGLHFCVRERQLPTGRGPVANFSSGKDIVST